MRNHLLAIALLTFSIVGIAWGGATSDASSFVFGEVLQGQNVEHQFVLRNDEDHALRIASVKLTPPLQLAKMPAVIPAHGTATLRLMLDTSNVEGAYQGELLVALDDAAATPRTFSIAGTVIPQVQVLPRPAFFLSTAKGTEKTASLEIVNRASEPLTLSLQAASAPHYRAELQTLEPGRRYRLTASIPATAPPGRHSDRLELASSNAAQPLLYIGLNTNVRERVHTFPDVVDFGQLKSNELQDAVATQTLMVYQTGGRDFTATGRSDIPGLVLSAERGADGDRVQITASLSGKAVTGPISGTIRLQTNDPEFPDLQVPVTGVVVSD